MRPYLSVVIPAYNESKNIRAGVLTPSLNFLKKQKFTWEVVFADDGSTDDTNKLLKNIASKDNRIRLLNLEHGGKVFAVRSGVLDAKGDYVLFTDLDQSTPLDEVSKFVAAHKNGAEICIGYRTEVVNDTFFRKLRNVGFKLLVQIFALPGIKDSQCGFKSFSHQSAQKLFSSLVVSVASHVKGGYKGGFDVELLYLARKFGYKIDQIPVRWIWRVSVPLNFKKEMFQMILDMFTVRYFDLMKKYDHFTNTPKA